MFPSLWLLFETVTNTFSMWFFRTVVLQKEMISIMWAAERNLNKLLAILRLKNKIVHCSSFHILCELLFSAFNSMSVCLHLCRQASSWDVSRPIRFFNVCPHFYYFVCAFKTCLSHQFKENVLIVRLEVLTFSIFTTPRS